MRDNDAIPPIPPGNIVAQVVFRHNPASTPQWSYYGINAPLAGSAVKLSEAKFAALQDLKFLSGEEEPALRSYAEWAVNPPLDTTESSADAEGAEGPGDAGDTHDAGSSDSSANAGTRTGPNTEVLMFVRTLQDEDTNLRLHRQNLAQAYLEGVRATPEIRQTLPTLLAESAHGVDDIEDLAALGEPEDLQDLQDLQDATGPESSAKPGDRATDGAEDGPQEIILVTLFPDDLLGDALLNLTERDSVLFCLPDGDSLSFLPIHGAEIWPEEGPGMLEQMGLDEFATVRNLMELSGEDAAGD